VTEDPASERRLVLLTGLLAALPIVVSAVEVLSAGWVPLADNALIATKSLDVLSSNSPLLGPWSSGYSAIVGEPTFHPGPLLFWLLALPARLPWDGSLVVTITLVNVAAVMGAVALARRRGGRALMFITAAAMAVMMSSLPGSVLSDIWNPSAPILPFALLIFLGWSLACGEYRLLPLTVLVASFVTQCHLGYLVPTLGIVAVGLAGLVLSRRSAADGAPGRWILAAVLVAVVCWSFPAIDQATNRPGNAVLIARAVTADEEKLGLDQGWRALVHGVGVVPWWLRAPEVPFTRVVDLSVAPGWFAVVTTLLLVAALSVLAVVGGGRAPLDVAAAAAIGLVLCVSLVLVTSSTPRSSFATLGYSLRWGSPAGMWVWLAVGWSVATLAGLRERIGARRVHPAAGLAAVAAVGVVVAASEERREEPYDQVETVGKRLDAALPADRAAVLGVAGKHDATFMALGIESGTLYALRHDGRRVAIPDAAVYLGSEYEPKGGEQPVRIDVGTEAPAENRVVARMPVVQDSDPADPFAPKAPPRWMLTVSLSR
jgi:hypothetical protein